MRRTEFQSNTNTRLVNFVSRVQAGLIQAIESRLGDEPSILFLQSPGESTLNADPAVLEAEIAQVGGPHAGDACTCMTYTVVDSPDDRLAGEFMLGIIQVTCIRP